MEKRSCIDCGVTACNGKSKNYPAFCLSKTLDPELLQETLACYELEENKKINLIAADVERDGYRQWPRVRETVEFAKRMGFRKIGIATCIGLVRESRVLAKILRSHGFEVFGVVCKCGEIPKADFGIQEDPNKLSANACNPILQAKLLGREKTELNIAMGLCVGHDMLFNHYSEVMVTTLVAKDRVTGHNPAAALYTVESYYKDLMQEQTE